LQGRAQLPSTEASSSKNADVGLPSRKLRRIPLDFIGEDNVSFTRQSDDSTKASAIVVLLGLIGRGLQAT
jgi:hypothetical protein